MHEDPWLPPETLAAPPRRTGLPYFVLPLMVFLVLAGVAVGIVIGRNLEDAGDQVTLGGPVPSPSLPLRRLPASPSARPSGPCTYEQEDERHNTNLPGLPPATGVRTAGTVPVTLQLAQGPVRLELFAGRAPCTVHSFLFLARSGFFDGSACHRLTRSRTLSVLQCGDPSGTGAGGPGYSFADEDTTGSTYRAGTVAMANAGPDTNGSQFFIVYQDSSLPPNYVVFGHVRAGLDVLRAIAAKGTTPPMDGRPNVDVRIRDVAIG